MTDLVQILPNFPHDAYTRLIPSLERNHITTADLITIDVVEIAKRAHLPLLDLKRLCAAVLEALQDGLEMNEASSGTISILDPSMDLAIGGIRTGYLTEVTGER
jgi:DNA repair protein RAD57